MFFVLLSTLEAAQAGLAPREQQRKRPFGGRVYTRMADATHAAL